MTETERSFLATKSFNTNLVHVLPLYHVIISNLHICPLPGFSLLGRDEGESPSPSPNSRKFAHIPPPPEKNSPQ